MLVIKDINKAIKSKIRTAKCEADMALRYRADYPEVAKVFNELSKSDLQDIELLHSNVERLIMIYRQKNGEPPVAMQAIYDWVHQEMIEDVKEIKSLQNMFIK